MKLCEAIRLGAMATTQGHGPFSAVSDTAPCALGAARLALGICAADAVNVYESLLKRYPWLRPRMYSHGTVVDVLTAIWMLNDNYGWTREQIAAWLEPIEDRAVVEVEVVVDEKEAVRC